MSAAWTFSTLKQNQFKVFFMKESAAMTAENEMDFWDHIAKKAIWKRFGWVFDDEYVGGMQRAQRFFIE